MFGNQEKITKTFVLSQRGWSVFVDTAVNIARNVLKQELCVIFVDVWG